MRCALRPEAALVVLLLAGSARAAGFGAHPLTSSCAASWFIDHVDASGKKLHLMAFVEGRPGWTQSGTQFGGGDDSLSFSCDGVPVRLTLDAPHATATLQGKTFALGQDNVFLIVVAGGLASVRGLGRHDLSFAEHDNPATELVARDAAVREALTGRPTPHARPAQASAGSPAARAAYDSGWKFYRASDFEHACDAFQQAAQLALPEGEYAYGYCLQSGKGRPSDLAAANAWYEKAAAHGNRDARFKLGWGAREGRGRTKDPKVALDWFRRCAAAGDSVCQALVGDAFERGDGTPAQQDSALFWYGMAAEHGALEAQYRMARAAGDQGADPSSGLFWISALEARKSELPSTVTDELTLWRGRLESRLTADQRAQVRQKADAWLEEESKRTLEALAR